MYRFCSSNVFFNYEKSIIKIQLKCRPRRCDKGNTKTKLLFITNTQTQNKPFLSLTQSSFAWSLS